MADLSTLARPYAKAAFDYAFEHGVADAWEDFLFIASTVVNDKSFHDMLDNPAIAADQKVAALVDLYDTQVATAGDTPFKELLASTNAHKQEDTSYPSVSAALKNFVSQLAGQERLALLPEVYEHFRRHKTRVAFCDVLSLGSSLTKGINSGAPGRYFRNGSGTRRP